MDNLVAARLQMALPLGFHILFAVGAVRKRRYQLARALAGLQVSAMVWGFAVGLQPYLIVPDVTVTNAAAPQSVLWPVLSTLSLGMVLLLQSFAFLYRVFDRGRRG